MIYALSEELSRTVSEIDGVVSARVHVVLPDNDPLQRNAVPASASVFIRHEAGLDINTLIPQIKTLVANGIAGLTYEKVSVIPVAAATTNPTNPNTELTSFLGIWLLPEECRQSQMDVWSIDRCCARARCSPCLFVDAQETPANFSACTR